MAEFHFVEDYRAMVRSLLAKHPRDEAMSIAVGGQYAKMGRKCAKLLVNNGLTEGMTVLDFGCGSGRVCSALSQMINLKTLVGIDIVEELLQYAMEMAPKHYEFVVNPSLEIPVKDNSFDYAYAFSVFTHLLQSEIYIYKLQIFEKLRPGGRFLYSFLELDNHWNNFKNSTEQHFIHGKPTPHLDMYLDRKQIELMCDHIGFTVESYVEPSDGVGQSVVVLRKPQEDKTGSE